MCSHAREGARIWCVRSRFYAQIRGVLVSGVSVCHGACDPLPGTPREVRLTTAAAAGAEAEADEVAPALAAASSCVPRP